MRRFDAVAFDLDGTLIGESCIVRPRVRAAIERMTATGIRGCIVTGRMYRAAVPFQETLGFSAPLVCYQGAAVVDTQSGMVLRDVPLENAVVRAVIERTSRDGMHLQLYRNDQYYCEQRNRFSDMYARLSGVEPVVVSSLAAAFAQSTATKAVVIADADRAKRYQPWLRESLGDTAYVTRSYPEFIEVLDPHVNKGDALAYVSGHLQIDVQRVAAIGDAWNDAPLLARAGFGIAMGTAPKELRAVAAAVVAGVEEDGVAEAIERYILG